MTFWRPPQLALAAALPLILAGCIPAAIPVAAGAFVAREELADVTGPDTGRGENPAPAWDASPSFVTLSAATVSPAAPFPAGNRVRTHPSAHTPYAAFTRYALDMAGPVQPGQARRSMLIDQTTLAKVPQLARCGDQPLAVVIDLDRGLQPFDPDDPPLPVPGLAEQLTALRNAGLTVLWNSSAPASLEDRIHTVLRASNLDPHGADRLLLVRGADERKQTSRAAAAQDWCIIAMAGDRRADFDEVFDYLRDPEGPLAHTLSSHLEAGWFLAPSPID